MADLLCRVGLRLAVLAMAMLGPAMAVTPEPVPALRLVTTHFPPYAMETGRDKPGPLAKLVLEAVARSGRVGVVDFVPWPRVQATAMRESHALIIPLVRTDERESGTNG